MLIKNNKYNKKFRSYRIRIVRAKYTREILIRQLWDNCEANRIVLWNQFHGGFLKRDATF